MRLTIDDFFTIYFNQKNYQAAQEAYQQAVELAPDDQDSRYNLAVAYLALEQVDRAFPILDRKSVV